ncbi:MAG: amidase [Geodermatophilaceae bacterium]|nr:amidase [Geodermatophilaceae bacterium]
MAVGLPTSDQLAGVAERYRLGLTAADVEEFAPFVAGLLTSWDAVEQLYARTAPTPRSDRAWSWPSDEENPLGAWYVRTKITERRGGPLAGRTVAIKDNTMVAGLPMMNGSRTVEGFVPTRDATIVSRLLAAGATITGKAVCEDLCFSGGSHTSASGPVRNPWDLSRSAGGSSSGSAALVAAGEVDLATGGDQGGSVRIPSAYSGTVGHKPTHGLVPYTGGFPIEQTIDHLGPITRTVSDAALVLGVIAGRDGLDPRQPADLVTQDYLAALDQGARGLRVGVVTEGFGIPEVSDPKVDDAVRAAVDVLREAGLVAEDVSVPWHSDAMHVWNVIATEGATAQMVDANAYGMNWQGLYDPELIAFYGRQWRERGEQFSETVKLVLLSGRHAIDTEFGRHYAMARNLAPELRAGYDAALETYDVLVMPTLPLTATEIPPPGASRADYLARALEMIGNTAPFDVTGHPATSVPTALVDGRPAGLMIIGRHFDDATCLRVAHTFERAVGGFPSPAQQTVGSRG